jgi:hypothetical protein
MVAVRIGNPRAPSVWVRRIPLGQCLRSKCFTRARRLSRSVGCTNVERRMLQEQVTVTGDIFLFTHHVSMMCMTSFFILYSGKNVHRIVFTEKAEGVFWCEHVNEWTNSIEYLDAWMYYWDLNNTSMVDAIRVKKTMQWVGCMVLITVPCGYSTD